jgi:hypothetical protein
VRTSAINQAKLVAQYTTSSSFTPYLSVAYRSREIDSKTGLVAGAGLYAYDPYDLGIVGRARLEHQIGFTSDSDLLFITAERRMSDSFAFGGGLQYGMVKYKSEGPAALRQFDPKGATFYGVSLLVRNDKMSGLSLFAQLDYIGEQVDRPAVSPVNAHPAGWDVKKDSTTLSGTLGVTYRFGTIK